MRTKMLKVRLKGKVVGSLSLNDKTYYRTLSKRRHFLWKLKAWGIDASVLRLLVKHGCEHIVIREKDSGKKFWTTLLEYQRHGDEQDLGCGRQVFLAESYWQTDADAQANLFETPSSSS